MPVQNDNMLAFSARSPISMSYHARLKFKDELLCSVKDQYFKIETAWIIIIHINCLVGLDVEWNCLEVNSLGLN